MNKKIFLIFLLFSTILISCDEMSGPTGRIEEVNNPIEVVEDEDKIIEVKFRDTHKQFRNNKIKLTNADLKGIYFSDEAFKKVKDTTVNIKEYEEYFLENAEAKGINRNNLEKIFQKLNLMLSKDILMYPVIIDTVVYKEKEAFAIAYKWTYKSDINEEEKSYELRNKMIIIVEQENAEVLSMLKLN